MAALDFPDAPTLNQVYDQWTWNGTLWVLTPAAVAVEGSGDTPGPWVDFPLSAEWTATVDNDGAKMRRNGKMVDIRVRARRTANVNALVGTLPDGYRPPLSPAGATMVYSLSGIVNNVTSVFSVMINGPYHNATYPATWGQISVTSPKSTGMELSFSASIPIA